MPPVRLGTIARVPIAMDWSWSIITVLMAGAFYLRVAPEGEVDRWAIVIAVVGAVLLLVSVLAHEVSHALAARRRGIGVRSVTLFVFGGYTEMEREPASPRDEFVIAGAGPAASLVLGAILWGLWIPVSGPAAEVLALLGGINLAVAVFNLLPGLPLDGGRLLRAAVWRITGDVEWAGRIAADAGRLLGLGIAVGGLVLVVAGRIVLGMLLLAVGWFLHRLAVAGRRTAGRLSTPVSDVMRPAAGWVAAETLAADLADAALPIPVVAGGRVIGTISAAAPGGASAGAAMSPLRPADVVDAATPIGMVASRVSGGGRTLVVVSEGRMVGMLTSELLRWWLAPEG